MNRSLYSFLLIWELVASKNYAYHDLQHNSLFLLSFLTCLFEQSLCLFYFLYALRITANLFFPSEEFGGGGDWLFKQQFKPFLCSSPGQGNLVYM